MNDFLPDGWEEAELNQILDTLESGSRPKGGVRGIQYGIPSLGGEHLNYDGSFNFDNIKYIPEAFAKNIATGQIATNDILLVKDGATTGKVAYVDSNFPYNKAYVNEHLFLCRPSALINPKFLFYFLWSEEGQKRILENFTGTAQGGINRSFAQNTIVPLAPLLEQQRIVAVIEERMQQVEQSRQQFQQLKDELRQFRDEIITAAVSGQLTEDWRNNGLYRKAELGDNEIEIPINWEIEKFGNLIESMKNGLSKKPNNTPPGIPILRISSVRPNSVDLTDHKFLVPSEVPDDFLLTDGDLLFTRYNGSLDFLGICGIVRGIDQQSFTYPDKLIRVRTLSDILLPEYTQLFFLSKYARELVLSIVKSSAGLNGISGRNLQELQFIWPPIEEQNEILMRVSNQISIVDILEASYYEAVIEVEALPNIILAKAFAGELTEQNPNDEPAHILLEQIRTEREAIQNAPKPQKDKSQRSKKMAEPKLLEVIQQAFVNEPFTFDQLRSKTTKGYEALRDELYGLIEVNKIIHQFDSTTKSLTFSLSADAHPTNKTN